MERVAVARFRVRERRHGCVLEGIVKLTKSLSIEPQEIGLQPVANPPCWASKTAASLNLTVSIIPLPAEVAR